MLFSLHYERCCPSELRPGEGKRVPRDAAAKLVGYYIGCPKCGKPQILCSAPIDPIGPTFVETEGALVSMSKHQCSACGRSYSIVDGAFVDAE